MQISMIDVDICFISFVDEGGKLPCKLRSEGLGVLVDMSNVQTYVLDCFCVGFVLLNTLLRERGHEVGVVRGEMVFLLKRSVRRIEECCQLILLKLK